MSTDEDLDSSDSFPEYQAHYVKTQTDLFSSNSNVHTSNYYSSNGINYGDYPHYNSEHELVDHMKCAENYHNHYLHSVSPVSELSIGSDGTQTCGNIPYPCYQSGRENIFLQKTLRSLRFLAPT